MSFRILALSDDRASNAGQALGMANAIARTAPDITVAQCQIPPRQPLLELATAYLGRPAPMSDKLRADLVIGAGRAGAIAAHWIKKRCDIPAICIMRPPLPGLHFDRVIVPEHDLYLRAGAIQTTGGLHAFTPENLLKETEKLPPTPKPLAAVLIGGPSGTAIFDASGEAQLIADMQALEEQGYHLYATASRRTPKPLVSRLRDRFPKMILWDGKAPNPYPGLLGRADVILVTSDSVSMISEALMTGQPVILSGSEQTAPKLRHFISAIESKLSPVRGPFQSYRALNETQRVAEDLAKQGLFAR